MNRILTALCAIGFVGVGGLAAASSVTAYETDVSGGDFSNTHNHPSVIGSDVTTVYGKQSNKPDSDWIVFDGFADGTESLDFTFTNEGGKWGGLNIRFKATEFTGKHDWWPLVFQGSFDNITDSTPLSFSYVLDGYTGPLYVALDFYQDNDFRNGNGLSYQIDKVGRNAPPMPAPSVSAVPLPASLPLALAGFGALAYISKRRRKS